MNRLTVSAVIAALAVAGAMAPSMKGGNPVQASEGYRYTIQGVVDEIHVAGPDEGICGFPESADFQGRWTLRVTATESGLSDDEVIALVEDGGPEVIHATYHEQGMLVIASKSSSGDHTYTTQYVTRWAANQNGAASLSSGFSAVGRSEEDTHFAIRSRGKVTFANGALRVDRDALQVTGCL